MSTSSRSLLESLRRPEYTGENRCAPCTIVNLLFGVGVAAAAGVLVARWIGLAVLAVALGSIYFRGYLVPGTPRLTKRYAPDFVLGAFGKSPTLATSNGDKPSRDLEQILLDADVLTECADDSDLCLSPEFRGAWFDRMDELEGLETSRDRVGAQLGVDPASVEYRDAGDAFRVLVDQRQVGSWPTAAAFAADLASTDLLPEWMDDWDALSAERRAGVTTGLRLFLDTCPACGADLQMTDDVVESCCQEIPVVALECTGCGVRLSEVERPDAAEN